MTSEQHPLDRQVQVVVDRLIDEDDQQHSREQIERMAQDVAEQHANAPIQNYVPNLVYNEVKTKMVRETEPTDRPTKASEGPAEPSEGPAEPSERPAEPSEGPAEPSERPAESSAPPQRE